MPTSKILVITVALLGVVSVMAYNNARPKRQINWLTDLDQAARLSRETGRPVMAYFTTEGCPPCAYLKAQVFPTDGVADLLDSRIIPLQLDLTDPSEAQVEMAMALRIYAFPTMIFFDADAREIDRIESALSSEELVEIMQRVLATVDEKTVSPSPQGT